MYFLKYNVNKESKVYLYIPLWESTSCSKSTNIGRGAVIYWGTLVDICTIKCYINVMIYI